MHSFPKTHFPAMFSLSRAKLRPISSRSQYVTATSHKHIYQLKQHSGTNKCSPSEINVRVIQKDLNVSYKRLLPLLPASCYQFKTHPHSDFALISSKSSVDTFNLLKYGRLISRLFNAPPFPHYYTGTLCLLLLTTISTLLKKVNDTSFQLHRLSKEISFSYLSNLLF